MKPSRLTAAAAVAVFAASAALAAGPVDVSPLVNDRTLLVAQIDLDQIKLRPLVDWAVNTATRAGVAKDMTDGLQKGAGALSMIAQPSIDGLRRAGVSSMGVVVQLNDTDVNAPPVLLLAVAKPADPKAVQAALAPLAFRSGEKNGLMVFSPNLPPGVLAKMTPAERPDLAVRPDTAVLAASVSLSPAAKADVLAKMTPADKAVEAFVRDVNRYELRVETAAGPHLLVTADAATPAAAEALKQTITQDRPGHNAQTWASLVKALPLTVAGSTLKLDAGQPEIDAFAKALQPALGAARASAKQVQSASNMRQLMVGSMMYAAENHGDAPPSLDALGKYLDRPSGKVPPALLTNPARPELNTGGYVFVPATEPLRTMKNAHARVALYEAGDFGDGVNVGFWDGHVERVTDEAKFKGMLDAATQKPDPAP